MAVSQPRGEGWVRPWDLAQPRPTPWLTMEYLEKVRSQFLSLRHPPSRTDFCVIESDENPLIKWDFSRVAAVLEICWVAAFRLGDGIFLQSSVLRDFSIV
jgi:hypothetical protein